jgi:hypothetical protein
VQGLLELHRELLQPIVPGYAFNSQPKFVFVIGDCEPRNQSAKRLAGAPWRYALEQIEPRNQSQNYQQNQWIMGCAVLMFTASVFVSLRRRWEIGGQ